jgi:L-lactate dehydrogenase (cytochrome)
MRAEEAFSSKYPSVEFLRCEAHRRVPGFAMDYLEGGCHSEINLRRNTAKIRELRLRPYYLRDYPGSDLSTELLAHLRRSLRNRSDRALSCWSWRMNF